MYVVCSGFPNGFTKSHCNYMIIRAHSCSKWNQNEATAKIPIKLPSLRRAISCTKPFTELIVAVIIIIE